MVSDFSRDNPVCWSLLARASHVIVIDLVIPYLSQLSLTFNNASSARCPQTLNYAQIVIANRSSKVTITIFVRQIRSEQRFAGGSEHNLKVGGGHFGSCERPNENFAFVKWPEVLGLRYANKIVLQRYPCGTWEKER